MLKSHEKFYSTNGKRLILIVDDEQINRMMLGRILEKEYEVLLENVSNFTAPELEKEIAHSIFKASKTDDTVASVGSFSMDSEKEKGKYGSLDRLFSK